MKPSELTLAIEIAARAQQPLMCWGNSGIGKSQIFAQTAERMGWDFYDLRMTGRDTVDFIGLPFLHSYEDGSRVTRWATPDFLPKQTGRPAIALIDEINRANQEMLNGGLQLVRDRRWGDYRSPDEVSWFAAGNYEDDPGVIRMSHAMKLRFDHVDLQADVDDWLKWAVTADLEPSVIAFIAWRREDALFKFDKKARVSPHPRGWEFNSNIAKQNPPESVARAMFCGNVGEGAGTEYCGFRRVYTTLPQLDAIFTNPATTPVPTEPSTLFAVAAGLGRRISPNNVGRAMTYLERLPEEHNVLAVHIATGRLNSKLTSTPEYTKWAITHSHIND